MGLVIKHTPAKRYIDKNKTLWTNEPEKLTFICGPGIKHEPCKECGYSADNLCDFPVGKRKTCDALMCDEHTNIVGVDTHYCDQHFKEWSDFRDSGQLLNALQGVVPFEKKYTGRKQT